MKHTILILLLALVAAPAFSQSKMDYEHAMQQFQAYYNRHQVDSICYICQNPDASKSKQVINPNTLDALMKQYGELKSFKFVDAPDNSNGVIIFKTNFSKATQFMGISLNKNKKIVSFKVADDVQHLGSGN